MRLREERQVSDVFLRVEVATRFRAVGIASSYAFLTVARNRESGNELFVILRIAEVVGWAGRTQSDSPNW